MDGRQEKPTMKAVACRKGQATVDETTPVQAPFFFLVTR
jgi:hypothetical protein